MSQRTDNRRNDARAQPPLAAIGAAVFAVALLASLALWTRFGEAVYIDRIFSAIANCF